MSSESGGQNPLSTVEQNQSHTADEPVLPPLETSTGKITDNVQVEKENGQSLDDEVWC